MSGVYHDVYSDTYRDPMAITLITDVSHYQGLIDWAAVARTPYRAGVARMTVGRTTRDNLGRINLHAMLGTMPVAGAYGVVGYSEPVEDGAKLLLDEIAAAGADPARILVMLDAEDFNDGSHPTIDQVDRYARQLHADLGRWPVAYVPDWWLDGHGYSVAGRVLANCPWAPSEYFPAPWTEERLQAHKPTSLHGFKRLGWLQFASSATIAGVSGNVDANCFYGTLDQLRVQLLGQEADMNQEEHDALMWLRANAVTLKDQGVQLNDHGNQITAGAGNHHKAIRADIADLRTNMATDLQAILDAVKAAADPTLLATLLAGQLEIVGIATDPAGVVTVTFGAKTAP